MQEENNKKLSLCLEGGRADKGGGECACVLAGVFVCAFACVCAGVFVCACVCKNERERQADRHRDPQTYL